MKSRQLIRYMGRVFLSFFFAVGIPVTVLTVFYLTTVVSEQQEQESLQYRSLMQKDCETVRAFMERAQEYTALMSKSAYLREAQNTPYPNAVYAYQQLLESMRAFCESRDAKTDCALYIAHSQKILSTQWAISSVEQYPDAGQLQAFLAQKSKAAFMKSETGLLAMMTLPKFYYDDSAVFLYYLDWDFLPDPENDAEYLVVRPDGEVLLGETLPAEMCRQLLEQVRKAVSGSFTANDRRVWYQTESGSGLILARVYDTAHFRELNVKIITVAVLTISGSMLCVCTIAFFAARQYTKPVKKLSTQIEKLPAEEHDMRESRSIFDVIGASLLTLQTQNESYREIIRQNQRIVEDHTIRDLMWGRIPTGYDIREFLRERRMDFAGESVCPVWVLSDAGLTGSGSCRISEVNILVKQLLVEYFSEKQVLIGSCLWELDKTALLLDGDAVRERGLSLEQSISETASILRERLHVEIRAIIGYTVETPEALCSEFMAARRQINRKDKQAIATADTGGETKFSPYLRTTLINAVRSGERDYVQEVSDKIFAALGQIEDRTMAENYLFSIVGSVQAHLFDAPVDIPPEELNFLEIIEHPQQREQLLVQKLTTVTDRFAAAAEGREDNVYVSRAREYMKRNLGRDLSLSDIAQHIGINVSYFSRIFKAGTGSTPLQYLTNLRIERAKELLTTDQLTIREIAEALGYNDTRSFNRFFKKLEGCTPGEYRAKHR